MKNKLLFTLTLFFLMALNLSAQTTWWVTEGGAGTADGTSQANASASLSGIISGATAGDTVNIVGTYNQTSSITLNIAIDFVGITSGTISGDNTEGFITINDDVTGVTFTDLTFQNFTKTGSGGVIQANTGSGTTITNCNFNTNTASVKGGAINIAGTANVSITNCTFTSNTSTSTTNLDGGGAIHNNSTGTVSITDSTFDGNAGRDGGAIHANKSITITNSTLKNNTSVRHGAGLYLNDGTATITGTLFDNNDASNAGGGIFANTALDISNTTFVNNNATNNGGAVRISGNSTDANTFTNVTFYNNTTPNTFAAWGGGLRVAGGGVRTSTFNNCLIFGNTSDVGTTDKESDIWSTTGQIIVLNNCIIGNTEVTTDLQGGDTNNNSTFDADLSSTTITFTTPNVTFTAPASISDDTPIDFGTDSEDVGAWNSNINLFKGTTDSDWATATNWSGTVPTATDNVTLLSDSPALVIGATTGAVANDLTVDAGSSLNITSGGSLILSGSSTGNITYNLSIADDSWHTITAPVSGEQFDTTWADANNIASGSGSNRGISWYDNGTPDVTTGYWRYYTGGSATTFGQGVGYSLKSTGATTYSFTGTYSAGDLTPAISMGASTNWNLIGNSFSSYIDIATFLTNNSANIDGSFSAVYVWDGSSYQMLTTGKLYPGQAFFINSQVNGTASIAASLQSHDTGTSLLKTPSTPSINLMISNNDLNHSTEINYLEGKTKGLDPRFDLGMFNGVSSELKIFTQLVSEDNGIAFARQALPDSEYEDLVVSVGVKAEAGMEITISADAMNLPSGLKVFLEDRTNNTFIRLDEANSEYKVTLSENLNGIGRFYLHTKSSALSTDTFNTENISVYPTSKSTLRIVGLSQGKTNVKLFNILGKQVLNTSFTSNGVYDVNLPNLTTGVYVVQLESENGSLNKKIVLE